MPVFLQPHAADVITQDINTQAQYRSGLFTVDFVDMFVEVLRTDQVENVIGICLEQKLIVLLLYELNIQYRLRSPEQQLWKSGKCALHRPHVIEGMICAAERHPVREFVKMVFQIGMFPDSAQEENRVQKSILYQQPG